MYTITDGMPEQGGVVGGEMGQVDDVQPANALDSSREEFFSFGGAMTTSAFLDCIVRAANTGNVELSADSLPTDVLNHIERGGDNAAFNPNYAANEGPPSTFDAAGPPQASHTHWTISTPALTSATSSPASSLNALSPNLPPATGNVSAQFNGWGTTSWYGNMWPMSQRSAGESSKTSRSVMVDRTQDAPRAHANGRYEPYRKPQAVAIGADLSEHNNISANVASAGGAQLANAGGIMSARHSAAQMGIVPAVSPSHAHGSAVTTQEQQAGAKDPWSNPPLEALMAPITLDSLNAIRSGRDTDKLECSFIHKAEGSDVFAPCGARFLCKAVRDRHVQSIHLKTVGGVCVLCNGPRVYSRDDSRLRHMTGAACPVTKGWFERFGWEYVMSQLQMMRYAPKEANVRETAAKLRARKIKGKST
ncbi:unnamed protein product [Peniophora sp. CBMAI 1063]|nr:unnamed protein product [Peniophora sp. CBMAI 1063]